MKKIFRAFVMCLSMFTVIPLGSVVWDEGARGIMLLFLPLCGAIIGGGWALLLYLLRLFEMPALVCGALLCVYPALVTGFIHLDGFSDLSDAILSRRDIAERRRILKDPHVGSFAVLSCIMLFVLQFAFLSSVPAKAPALVLFFIPVVTRALAALCVTVLRPISESEYAGLYREGIKTSHAVISGIVAAAAVALCFVFCGLYGFAPLAAGVFYLLFVLRGVRALGGMSGDVSGHALCVGELCAVAVFALL